MLNYKNNHIMKSITFLITLILASFSYAQTLTTANIDNLNFETGTNSFTENGVAHGWEVSSVFPNRTVSMDLVSDPHNGTNTILSVHRGVNNKAGTTSGIKIESESYAEVNFNPLPETVVPDGAAYILRVKIKVRAIERSKVNSWISFFPPNNAMINKNKIITAPA